MPKTSLTTGRCGGVNRVAGERWRPLAHHLAMRFAAAGGHDAETSGIAFGIFADAEQRLDPRRPDFLAIVVPLVVRALRRHRHDRIWSRSEAVVAQFPALQPAMVAAERALSRHLRRSPTIAEVAAHLNLAGHRIVAALEVEWAAGTGVSALR